MIHFSFVASNSLESDFLNNLEARVEAQETVALESLDELEVLLKLFGTCLNEAQLPEIDDVENSWVLSQGIKYFGESDFEVFYQEWLKLTDRDNNMDEYGQLLHLNSFAVKLNQANHQVVLQEAI